MIKNSEKLGQGTGGLKNSALSCMSKKHAMNNLRRANNSVFYFSRIAREIHVSEERRSFHDRTNCTHIQKYIPCKIRLVVSKTSILANQSKIA